MYVLTFAARLYPVACSNFTCGNRFATFTVGFMNPNDVVKIRPCPVAASWRMTRSASGPSLTLSTNVVSTSPPELTLDRLAPDVVSVSPAVVADGPHVDESHA